VQLSFDQDDGALVDAVDAVDAEEFADGVAGGVTFCPSALLTFSC
jgi:hypothetical protein